MEHLVCPNYQDSPFRRRLKHELLLPVHWLRWMRVPKAKRNEMLQHARRVRDAPDFDLIEKHVDAGKVIGRRLVMHNGLRVLPTAYYGYQFLARAQLCQTVDEPQEERVFGDLLKQIPEGSTMLELGSFWAFYSLWFHSQVRNARNFMIEPELKNMLYGKTNFEINKFFERACFTNAFIDHESRADNAVPTVCVDDYCQDHEIGHLSILHSDIQGYESAMLDGASRMLNEKKIDYLFISTHSNELHAECIGKLQAFGYVIRTEANLDEAYQADGVIFASLPHLPKNPIKPVSKRPTDAQKNHAVI